ncbi:MAG: hypothetical protein BJ554DRAFT_4018, partial [Olpidium bornovanus]
PTNQRLKEKRKLSAPSETGCEPSRAALPVRTSASLHRRAHPSREERPLGTRAAQCGASAATAARACCTASRKPRKPRRRTSSR